MHPQRTPQRASKPGTAALGGLWVLGLASLGLASVGHAQYGATAVADRPIPAGSEQDPTAAATVVDAEDRVRAAETTDELMREVPGARARKTGGRGSFRGLSLRGAELEHTTVLFGTIPLGPGGGSVFDLSTIPLAMLERVEVYRGGAPLWLGADGIGGVLRLVPRQGDETWVQGTGSVGSFGRRAVKAAASVTGPRGSPAWTTVAGVRHTDGDYPFVDDGGTRLDPDDDVERRRRNGRVDEGWGLGRLQLDAFGGEFEALVAGFGRTGGLTGSPVEEPLHTTRKRTWALGGLSWTRRNESARVPWRVQLTAAGTFDRKRVTDRFAEIGVVPQATDDRTYRGFTRAAATVEPAEMLSASLVTSYTYDRFHPHDALSSHSTGDSARHTGSAGAELRLHGELAGMRTELRASSRVRAQRARLVDPRQGREGNRRRARTAEPQWRVAGVLEPWSGLAWSASVSSATRFPSLLELFGDRAFILGNTTLSPERSLSVQTGLVATGRRGPVSGTVEARLFGLFVDDLIRYVKTAQFRLSPQNVARATILGGELGMRGRFGEHVRTVGNLTWMHTHDHQTGRELPLRPRLEGYLRPELVLGPYGPVDQLTLFGEVTHVGSNFTDPANRVVIAPRTLLGSGIAAEFLDRRVEVAATARNLLDERPLDLVGFPLPGRSFAIELTLREKAP